jgi:alpha-glucosidase
MLALPGAAYLYQGEELGLPEVSDLPDHLREDPSHKRAGVPGRDGCRVPLPWTADAPAFGFSSTGESWLPQPTEFGPLAVDQQAGREGSTLELYRSALHLRSRLGLGRWADGVRFLEDMPEGILALVHGGVAVLVNTTDEDLAIPRDGELTGATVLLGSAGAAAAAPATADAIDVIPVESTLWLQVPELTRR